MRDTTGCSAHAKLWSGLTFFSDRDFRFRLLFPASGIVSTREALLFLLFLTHRCTLGTGQKTKNKVRWVRCLGTGS